MRYIGSYEAALTPTVAQLFALSAPNRRAVLQRLLPEVQRACAGFEASLPDVHTLVRAPLTEDSAKALIEGYDHRSSEVKACLAAMRDSLGSAHADLCPYCSLDSNPDLDHFLPKDRYPEFALFAKNFVPICAHCNRKSTSVANAAGERQFIFPTEDTWAARVTLQVELGFQGELNVRYFVSNREQNLPEANFDIIQRHFMRLGLADRYRKRAHGHLSAAKQKLRGQPLSVCRKILESVSVETTLFDHPNSWKPPLYHALSEQPNHAARWFME